MTIFLNTLLANSENISMMNDIKRIIQKEEYIALAVNKYILQEKTIPKITDNSGGYILDWDKLLVDEYLGENFNKTNELLQSDIYVYFDLNNNCFIKGVVTKESEYNSKYNYLYNYYNNKIFRVNTIPPIDKTLESLSIGSQILYSGLQKEIVNLLTKNKIIKFSHESCTKNTYFYELSNSELKYKYCKNDNSSLFIYQDGPIYSDNIEDLQYIKANIGDKAYIKKNNFWYEYYFQGETAPYWIPIGRGSILNVTDDSLTLEERILAYIPNSKDLVLKNDGGCMLANGDIFCWGNNSYKKAGIENYGQLDRNLSPDYVNTPVMLKVQIDNTKELTDNNGILSTRASKRWYNNPYRIKFEKMALNSKNVCAISPIFSYYESGLEKKTGGDLYCNGYLSSEHFEDVDFSGYSNTSILKRNKYVYNGKSDYLNDENEIYLIDIVMVDGTWILLSDSGEIYTVGSNEKGALGNNNEDETFYTLTPQLINSSQVFKKIYALRDIKGFGALDTNNNFWYWGERNNGKIYYKPTLIASGKTFYDNIFVNSKEFVLKGYENIFYRTSGDLDISALYIPGTSDLIPSSALSVAYYNYEGEDLIAYVDEHMQLQGSSELKQCWNADITSCSQSEDTIFNNAFNELNEVSTSVNGIDYSSFSNIGIFESKLSLPSLSYYTYTEDFEDSSTNGWNVGYIYDGADVASKFLGRFGKTEIDTSSGNQTVYKTFDLGIANANANVKITFDMYEIDSWDANQLSGDNLNGKTESFFVYINDNNLSVDTYAVDSSYPNLDTKDGVDLGNIINTGYQTDEKHTYTFVVTLDSLGKVKLGFGAILGETTDNESFGIDNIKITTQIDNVSFSGTSYLENFEDMSYSDWIVPRGPAPWPDQEFENYPIYEDFNLNWLLQKVHETYFLGRFNRLDGGGGAIYHGNSDGSQEVSKIFSFGSDYAGKEVKIEYDFYRIDDWRYNVFYTIDRFYTFVNDNKTETYPNGFAYLGLINNIENSSGFYIDYKYHFSKTEYLDSFGNIKLGFGAYIKDNYINQTSWGVDNIKITLTGNSASTGGGSYSDKNMPYVCTMTGIGSSSQMYCWGNTGRSLPILSTSLYDVAKISTMNKLFISQNSEKNEQMSFDEYNNYGNLYLKYPTYIGGFDYEFYFK